MCSPPAESFRETEPDQLSLVMIMGVSASGKSTIGQQVADKTGAVFIDSDEICPREYVEKMRDGISLTDEDRVHWYRLIVDTIEEQARLKRTVVVACSAQKKIYRKIFKDRFSGIKWFHLTGDYELVSQRLKQRKDHFFPLDLLKHQFDIFENEEAAIVLDISTPKDQLVNEIIVHLSESNVVA